jgi:D-serine deaminase-like pyridoxal phosphate-dependent protein
VTLLQGNYVFYDRQQVNCGACSTDDIAATVLARVVGAYPHNNHFLIDAGALALSKDLAPPHTGYGGIRGHPQLEVVKVTQELGKVSTADGSPVDFARFPVGSLVEVLPNHNW